VGGRNKVPPRLRAFHSAVTAPPQSSDGFHPSEDLLDPLADVFICFRGTEPTKIVDWLSDVNFRRVDFCESHGVKPGLIRGLVHGGFAAALNVVRNDLLRAVALLGAQTGRANLDHRP
jgi:hypothetical protein